MDIHCIWWLDEQLRANIPLRLLKQAPMLMVSQICRCSDAYIINPDHNKYFDMLS